ncbi:CaiB/BaiF CoA-transferase family protein [Cohnella sp. WQ 127256]|uniref:CaiB/BaiF CoA transferase family protein n=1 Tax=Cohnella sp. WQ 127256 TaxID=2938790 RepID=UPI0021197BB0|nr:CaiB/BaiF CoA-transferase family protein [Cohnella sp. WQ 127256]
MTMTDLDKPLQDMLVLDFSQFLSGPSASLRLADMGARVIKVERSGIGDICRTLYISNMELDGDSTLFHSINRNKESLALDLKNPTELDVIKKLIGKADVMIGNFRPGVMERLGLSYEHVKLINPQIIYGEITGYGHNGPWRDKPGQDLLVQSLSGLAYLNGDAEQPPMPFGLAVADMMAGAQLAQGILACLVRRGVTSHGALVQASLLEATLDFQFEVLTTYLNEGKSPVRSSVHNAHAYLGAPYGIYRTKDGYLALAMGSVVELGHLLGCPEMTMYTDSSEWSTKRDEIKRILAAHLLHETTELWLSKLEPADYWCADVLSWDRLLKHEGFQTLQMTQQVTRSNGASLMTTRCPIRIDRAYMTSPKGSPRIGEHNEAILQEIAGM